MNQSSDAFIEYAVNQYLQSFLRTICENAHCAVPETVHTYRVSIQEEKKKEEQTQCLARVKNNGWGRQCSRNAQGNSNFCGCHAKQTAHGSYAWQTFGRIDEPAPPCFIEWYAKHDIHITNPKLFFAVNVPRELSIEDMRQLTQATVRYC
jgi:hypothetical protein